MDIFNLPNFNEANKFFFLNSTAWQTWTKPSGAKFVYFYVIGGGGSGGGGRTGGINSGGGGGGGGSSALSTGLYPAFVLPDILYIRIGAGGASVGAGTAGNAGDLSYVSTQPNTNSANIVMRSGDAAAGGGGAGTNSAGGGGAGGIAGTNWSYTNNPLTNIGMITSIAGQTGANGGTNVPAAGGTVTPTLPVTGGAGGGGVSAGGTSSAGGNITGSGFLPTISGGAVTTAATLPGMAGYSETLPTSESFITGPLVFTGGSGGAAASNALGVVGGVGGPGLYGSGGGGGGASYASTGGASGRGGDGLVLVVTW
jgi:hypothetical protein